MGSLHVPIPERFGNLGKEVRAMLEDSPPPQRGEYQLEKAPVLLLKCMALYRLLTAEQGKPGLDKKAREQSTRELVMVNAIIAVVLQDLSRKHNRSAKVGNVRSDGYLYSRSIGLPPHR